MQLNFTSPSDSCLEIVQICWNNQYPIKIVLLTDSHHKFQKFTQ